MKANLKLPPRPRMAKTEEVERLLRAAAAVDLPESSPDLVARAAERALAKRATQATRPTMPRVALGTVVFAGIVALAAIVALPFLRSPRSPSSPSASRMPMAAIAALSPVVPGSRSLSPRSQPFRVVATQSHTLPPVRPQIRRAAWHRLVVRRHRPQRAESATTRHAAQLVVAPKVIEASRSILSPRTQNANTSPPMLGIAQSRPAPARPFWHDEQVERDDYIVSAPAIIAEGTDQGVTSVTPGVVQVAFSTTRPAAANAANEDEPGSH